MPTESLSGNTRSAHRLVQAAADAGVQGQLVDALFQAHFGRRESIFDEGNLRRIAVEAGLTPDQIDEALGSEAYAQRVFADRQAARLLGITGVPFFVVDDRFGISGAQPVGSPRRRAGACGRRERGVASLGLSADSRPAVRGQGRGTIGQCLIESDAQRYRPLLIVCGSIAGCSSDCRRTADPQRISVCVSEREPRREAQARARAQAPAQCGTGASPAASAGAPRKPPEPHRLPRPRSWCGGT